MSSDPYVYPGTEVLRNALGIRDLERLRRVEADLTSARAARLTATPLAGRYDLTHLRAFHRALFVGLYEWAGELRTVAIAEPGSMFALPQHIKGYADDVFGRMARERHLTGLRQDAFPERLAHYLGDINAMHPFREGDDPRAPRGRPRRLPAALGPRRPRP